MQRDYSVSRECKETILEKNQFFLHSVSSLLYKKDLANIGTGQGNREYDLEACSIINHLPCCNSLDDLVDIVHEVFIFWFDEEIAGNRERFRGVSSDIWAIWLHKNASIKQGFQ